MRRIQRPLVCIDSCSCHRKMRFVCLAYRARCIITIISVCLPLWLHADAHGQQLSGRSAQVPVDRSAFEPAVAVDDLARCITSRQWPRIRRADRRTTSHVRHASLKCWVIAICKIGYVSLSFLLVQSQKCGLLQGVSASVITGRHVVTSGKRVSNDEIISL